MVNHQRGMTMDEKRGRDYLIFTLVALITFVAGIYLGATIERTNSAFYIPIEQHQDFIMLKLDKIIIKEQLLQDMLKTLEAYGMEIERLVIQKDGVKQLDTRMVD